ncbi:hypothetical protein [Streptomyces lavendofoliae]|uniref:hypothetical protein n=1 Tax=Streptomyces lavendofoliae TaxID=67314 RepID=UPI001673E44E|nr:hypothetical protein [Streptomyces lavendofoliae]
MTTRRALGAGPEVPAQGIRAAEADLLAALPGVRLPDLDELRARGVLGARPASAAAEDPKPAPQDAASGAFSDARV